MDLKNSIYSIGAWIGVILIGAATLILALQERWEGAGLMAAFLVGSLTFIYWRSRLPNIFSLLFVIAAILNAGGWVFDLWDAFVFYDPITHAFTSFTITLAVSFAVYYSFLVQFKAHGWLFVMSVTALGLSLGALWEIVEWTINVEQTYTSLVTDLITDSLGALAAGLLAAWFVQNKSESQLQSQESASNE